MTIRFKDSFTTGGHLSTGNINFNNGQSITFKTSADYTNTSDSSSVAAGTSLIVFNYNSSGNLHIGSGTYDKNLNTGNTYVSSPNNILYRTKNNGYHSFQIQGTGDNATLVSFKSDGNTFSKVINASSGIISGSNIRSDTALTDQCGTSAYPWFSAHSRYWNLRGDDSGQTYGSLFVGTLGTTSDTGESRMTVGNNLASGTANNAQGRIWMYGTNTGYTAIVPGNNSTGNIIVTLPSASGKIPIMVMDDADYWGILPPTGNESSWLRSPKSGLIPFEKNSEISSLGTASWPWYNVCGKNFRMYDKNGQTYGYMNVVTDGTADTQGETRLTLGNNISSGAAKNSYGRIAMYGTNTGYTMITPGNNSTSNITITLPSSGGTLARTSDNVASATKLNTARTLTIGATGKTFDGSGNVSWSLKEIMKGQGLNSDSASNTLYFNNAGTEHVGRISCYNNADGDYAQFSLYNTADQKTVAYLNVYSDCIATNGEMWATKSSGNTYLHTKRSDTGVEVSFGVGSGGINHGVYSQKLGKWIIYGDETDVWLPNSVKIGGHKFTIHTSSPTSPASGDIWIDI